ncbi:MAG: hypothetical protein EXR39_13140 [Betaproteobacteria bacterium]|nr:hypothetical protein [Betaproteobacteria bacterium]
MHDLVIAGAQVFDGLGNAPQSADLAVKDGRIVAIGKITDAAKERLNADGLALAPGIVDLHTHYDAQVTWDPTLSPSPSLGVTTAVMGNCGFGIAPCPPAMRETLLRNLSVVEGMELDALQAGTRWEFQSFREFIGLVRKQRPYINTAVFAQHSTIRSVVMGAEASTRAEATPAEMDTMKRAVRDAMDAGAIGFASSFSPNHSGWGGLPMPSCMATDAELESLVGVLGEVGRGVFMMATGPRATPQFMEGMAKKTKRPMFISTALTMYNEAAPERAMTYYDYCAGALARGNEVYIQTTCQPLSFTFDLLDPYILYSHDAFDRMRQCKPAELRAVYSNASFREAFRANLAKPKAGIIFYGNWNLIEIAATTRTENTKYEGKTVGAAAREADKDPLDFFFDLALSDALGTTYVGKFFQNNDKAVAPLISHPAGVITLSDAGAHLKFLCDAGFGLYLLGHWVREQGVFTLQEGIRRLTSDPAKKYRIPDRGYLQVGAHADLLLFDPQTVGISKSIRVGDLPAGGSRLIRKPTGVKGVWVNGTQVFDGNDYPKLAAGPGQLLDKFLQ